MPRKTYRAILNIVALENCRTGVTESLRRSKGGNMAAILKKKSWYRDYLLIFLGTALMSVALNSAFEQPNGLVDGQASAESLLL